MNCLDCVFGTPVFRKGASGALKGIDAWCSIYEEYREKPCEKFITSGEFHRELDKAFDADSLPAFFRKYVKQPTHWKEEEK